MSGYIVTLLVVVQVLSAIAIIVLVLLQHGKGADMGAAFGGGASGSLFGATGSANFLSRATAGVATVFFIATLALAYLGTAVKRPAGSGGVMDSMPAPTAPAMPRDIPLPTTPQNTSPAANTAPAGAVPAAPAATTTPGTPATPVAPKPADVPK